MERREFLIGLGAALVAPPAMDALSGCSSSSGTSTTSFDVVSSVADGHTHNVTVQNADLANPPAVGVVYTTTAAGGHVHTVTIARGDLALVEAGQTATETTSTAGEVPHQHTFAITKPSPSSAGSGGGGYG